MTENGENAIPLPSSEFEEILRQELETVFADTRLPDARIDKLAAYGARLAAASSQVNLTRILDPHGMAVRHFLDSYHLLPVLKQVKGRVLDMGTGGGVPGMVLAILRRDLRVVMIDGTGKKIRFLKEWIEELKIKNASALQARAEEHLRRFRYDVAMSRAAVKPEAMMEFLIQFGPAVKRLVFMEGSRGKEKAQALMPLAREAGYDFDLAMPYRLPGLDHDRYLVCFKRRVRTRRR